MIQCRTATQDQIPAIWVGVGQLAADVGVQLQARLLHPPAPRLRVVAVGGEHSGCDEGLSASAVLPRSPRIERRRVMRTSYRTQAWLQPADETGAIRSPLIHTRDLDETGVGFIARQDLSAVGDAVLFLPSGSGRPVRVPWC